MSPKILLTMPEFRLDLSINRSVEVQVTEIPSSALETIRSILHRPRHDSNKSKGEQDDHSYLVKRAEEKNEASVLGGVL